MTKIKVYLDSCILISFFSKLEKEKDQREMAHKLVKRIGELSAVDICISPWVISEMINILLNNHKMGNKEVLEIESELINKERLGTLKIKILKVGDESQKNYSLEDFFYDVRKTNLKYHPGIADAMHIVIMKNNNVNYVVTFNEKDFEEVEGLKVASIESILSDKQESE